MARRRKTMGKMLADIARAVLEIIIVVIIEGKKKR
jgi:hypothetical protein